MTDGSRSFAWLAFVLTLAAHVAISLLHPMPGEFLKYTEAARLHLAGELPAERLVDFSPLYFELTLAVTRLTPAAELVLGVVQLLLVAGAAGFLAWLLARRFGRGLAAAGLLVFVLDRHVLVYERILEPEACLLFFVLGWIFFLERTLDAESWRSPVAAGLMAAASLLTRPTFLPVSLVVPLYFRARDKSVSSPSIPPEGTWRRRSVLFAGPVLAAFVLLMVRAEAITGDPRTPVMNPGTVFYEGNQPLSRGTSARYPVSVAALIGPEDTGPDMAHEHYRTIARASTGQALSISEVNAYWSGLAVDFIRAEPGRYLALLSEKLTRLFHAYRWHDISTAWRYDRLLTTPHVSFALLAALGLVGMIFEARRRPTAFVFYGLAGLQIAVMTVFYVSARQRLLLLPAIVYFALAGAEALIRERGRPRRLVLWGTLVLLLALSFSLPDDLALDDRHKRHGNALAQAKLKELRERNRDQPMAALVDLALEALRHGPWVEWTPAYFPQEHQSLDEALADSLAAVEPVDVPSAFDRAVVFLRAGRIEEAEAILEGLVAEEREVYRGSWQPSLPRFYLARAAVARQQPERAVALLEDTLERSPGNPLVLAELFALTGDPRYEEALAIGISRIDARLLLGRALLDNGKARDAVTALEFVAERVPELRVARIYLAAALGEAGRVDEAAALYLEAVREKPDPLLLSRRISELFERWAALHPGDPRVGLLAGHVLHEHGRFSTALEILEGLEPPEDARETWAREVGTLRQSLALLEGR